MSGKTEVRTVPKPWGHETIWAANELYVGKVLHIKAGQSLSVQYHNHKDETIHVLSGTMIYRVGKATPEIGSRKPEARRRSSRSWSSMRGSHSGTNPD